MALGSTPDYRSLIRAIKPGQTLGNVLEMLPDAGISITHDIPTSEFTITDRRGLVINGFRDRVASIVIKFVWNATWQDLENDVSVHLEVPSDAVWLDAPSVSSAVKFTMQLGDTAEAGVWQYGDTVIFLGLENGIAFVCVKSSSASEEAEKFIESAGLLDDQDRVAKTAYEQEVASRLAVPAPVQLGTPSVEPYTVQNLTPKMYVQLASKSFHPKDLMAGDIGDRIDFVFYFQPADLDKDVRAFKGDVIFTDLFDEFILRVTLTHEAGLATYEVAEWSGGIEYNQFLPEHQRLRSIDPKNLSVSFELQTVVYTDGTRESFGI